MKPDFIFTVRSRKNRVDAFRKKHLHSCGVYIYKYNGRPIYVGASCYLSRRSLRVVLPYYHGRGDSSRLRKALMRVGTNNIVVEIYLVHISKLADFEINLINKLKPVSQHPPSKKSQRIDSHWVFRHYQEKNNS